MDYFIIMIYLFFYWIKLHNAIIWFLFELYSKKIFFTQWVKTKFPFPLNVLSPIPSTKIPVPVDQIPFSHPYFRPIQVPFYPFRTLLTDPHQNETEVGTCTEIFPASLPWQPVELNTEISSFPVPNDLKEMCAILMIFSLILHNYNVWVIKAQVYMLFDFAKYGGISHASHGSLNPYIITNKEARIINGHIIVSNFKNNKATSASQKSQETNDNRRQMLERKRNSLPTQNTNYLLFGNLQISIPSLFVNIVRGHLTWRTIINQMRWIENPVKYVHL